jgi:predicted DNA-binding transcriptional regulator YafY
MSAADADGWVTTDLLIESVRHAHHALLQLGEHVEVLAPAELRDLIAESGRALVDRYG